MTRQFRYAAALILVGAFATGVFAAAPASADVLKIMNLCPGNKLCPTFLPVLPKPAHWTEDQDATRGNGVEVLVPNGSDFSSAEAVIYGRAFFNSAKQTIDERVAKSNEEWGASVKDAKIERLPDVTRTNGKAPAFQVYHYTNPSQSQQRSELVAFGEDTDKDGNLFGVQIVLTTMGEPELKRNEAAYMAVLTGF